MTSLDSSVTTRTTSTDSSPTHTNDWWRSAVIYQIYPRSFADANGDGIGDLKGVIAHLDYLKHLGIDALWLSPFYRSPQADAGYDVANYRDVDPMFGTLADFDTLLDEAHERGIRVIVDLVPNHSSDEHEWFQAALKSAVDSPERKRYLFRKGKGPNSDQPPNNWPSVFGGAAWTRVEGEDEWYLHLFDTKQPDYDWRNPEVRKEFESILHFWLDRGVDGFRVDVAHSLIKEPDLRDMTDEELNATYNLGPMWDQDEVHDIYRAWRKILNQYPGNRMMVAEAWVKPQERLSHYIRSDEMQQAFNFDYLLTHWNAKELRQVIDDSLAQSALVGAPTTWVMSNHDGVRQASRFGLSDPGARPNGIGPDDEQPDEALGLQRARASIFLTFLLPGSLYLYQGEELGLPDNTTMAPKYRQDPTFFRTHGKELGRDGCRVPLPWKSHAPSLGFGPSDKSWLPQPDNYAHYAVDVEENDPESTLALYRALLGLRKQHALGTGHLQWLDSPNEAVLVARNGDVVTMVNTGSEPVALLPGRILAHSLPGEAPEHQLPGNAAVWIYAAD
ncbi:Oligo-1,6-glucosidase GH31 [Halomonadaceae bacterium LMG 33818]|uniref:glycoside hydrolase family 13 protein n=1 Tax=Cernens ardua TaxID=3402176 RepID=UPI003EDC3A0A